MFMGKTLTKDNFYNVLNRKQELSSKKSKHFQKIHAPETGLMLVFEYFTKQLYLIAF